MAIGVWSGISGIAVALGPLVGGAVVQAGSWHWIFWINVPIGTGARSRSPAVSSARAAGRSASWTCAGSALGSSGLFGIVYGLVRSQSLGWTSPEVVIALVAGAVLVVAFIAYELRAPRSRCCR